MTRMGLHINAGGANAMAVEYCRVVRPAVVKSLIADRALFEAIKAASPHTRIVYRHYWEHQRFDTHSAYISAVRDAVAPVRDLVSWAEGWNEYTSRDPREQRRFASAEVRFASAMLEMGVGAAIGGYSTGFLDSSGAMFDAALPILEMCHAHSGVVVWHSHEYAAPYMAWMVRTPDGANQWDRSRYAWTGFSPDHRAYWDPSLDGWLTLRYRMFWKVLRERGLKNVRMILSETGIDDVNPRPGPQGKGWRDYAGQREWEVLGDYADQQRWYGWHISHDHYVLGWVDFGFGAEDPAWNSFRLDADRRMFDRVMQEQLKLSDGFIGSPSAPPADAPPRPLPEPSGPPLPTTPPVSVRRMPRPAVEVMRGDSWWGLARSVYGKATSANVAALRQANGDAPLVAGMRVWVPGWKAVAEPTGSAAPASERQVEE